MTGLLLALTLSCGDKPNAPRPLGDAQAVADAAWQRAVPFALKAGYSVHIEAPRLGLSGTTRGALIVHRPGKFRLDIYSPLGSPLVYAASDGKALGIYVAPEKMWLGSDNAEGLLREMTGNAAGLEDLVALMTGRLPFQDAEIVGAKNQGDEAVYTFKGPEDTKAIVVLDPRKLTSRRIEAYDPTGAMVLEADYEDYSKVGRTLLPEAVRIKASSIDFLLELEFDAWDEIGVIPDAFQVPAPPGSRVIDLDDLVVKARYAAEQGDKPRSLDELLKVQVPESAP